jgi:hypothetical protein
LINAYSPVSIGLFTNDVCRNIFASNHNHCPIKTFPHVALLKVAVEHTRGHVVLPPLQKVVGILSILSEGTISFTHGTRSIIETVVISAKAHANTTTMNEITHMSG